LTTIQDATGKIAVKGKDRNRPKKKRPKSKEEKKISEIFGPKN